MISGSQPVVHVPLRVCELLQIGKGNKIFLDLKKNRKGDNDLKIGGKDNSQNKFQEEI